MLNDNTVVPVSAEAAVRCKTLVEWWRASGEKYFLMQALMILNGDPDPRDLPPVLQPLIEVGTTVYHFQHGEGEIIKAITEEFFVVSFQRQVNTRRICADNLSLEELPPSQMLGHSRRGSFNAQDASTELLEVAA
jgi:hypothetical protein